MEFQLKSYAQILLIKQLLLFGFVPITNGQLPPQHLNTSRWDEKDVEIIVNFIEDVTNAFKWQEFFLFSDAIKDLKTQARLLKRFANNRIHLSTLPMSNIDQVLNDDVTSHYHKVVVWSEKDNMQLFVTQAMSSSLFKSSIVWLFIGSDLKSIFDPLRYDYGEEAHVATLHWSTSGPKTIESIEVEHVNGNSHTDSDIRHIGKWSANEGLAWDNAIEEGSTSVTPTLRGNILQIAVREEVPFYYYEHDDKGTIIRSRGIISDLLNLLQDSLQFRLNITIPKEINSGTVNDTGHWNGLIGLLQRKEVDMVAAEISLTEDRLTVAEFSPPFLMAALGIAVLKKAPPQTDYHFLPFAFSVWILIGTSICLSAILLTASSCWSPARNVSAEGPQRNIKFATNNAATDTSLNFGSSLFVMLSLMAHQGLDDIPRPTSAKVIFIVHCLFAFLILESYASVLTASLSTTYGTAPFSQLEELVDNSHYQFGIREGSSNVEYLKTSRSAVLKKAWTRINSSPDNFCNSTTMGLRKAATETFAYIDNYATLKFHLSSSCKFQVLKQGRDIRGYHFAFPKNSPFLQRISTVFRKLANSGILQILRRRHFKTDANCKEDKKAEDNRVHLKQILGLMQFLCISYATSCVILLVEQALKRNVNHKGVKFFSRLLEFHVARDHLKVATLQK